MPQVNQTPRTRPASIYLALFFSLAAALLIMSVRCLRNSITLNRSKSFKLDRALRVASFLAQLVDSHFLEISAFSMALRTCPLRVDRTMSTLRSVSASFLNASTCRDTPVVGPSTSAWVVALLCVYVMGVRHVGYRVLVGVGLWNEILLWSRLGRPQ